MDHTFHIDRLGALASLPRRNGEAGALAQLAVQVEFQREAPLGEPVRVVEADPGGARLGVIPLGVFGQHLVAVEEPACAPRRACLDVTEVEEAVDGVDVHERVAGIDRAIVVAHLGCKDDGAKACRLAAGGGGLAHGDAAAIEPLAIEAEFYLIRTVGQAVVAMNVHPIHTLWRHPAT